MAPITPGWAQTAFTAILVGITAFYAWQTHRHVVLAKNQINREARRHHSEILRQKVSEWLENLPAVRGARAESALNVQGVGHPFFDEGHKFWTIPLSLHDDPYFNDFLAKHGTECSRLKEHIETKYREYQDLRERFYEQYDGTEHIDQLPFDARPLEKFPLWAFENGVLLERGVMSREEQMENLEQAIENDKMAQRPPGKQYACSLHGWGDPYIVEADTLEIDDLDDLNLMEEREEQVIQALHDTLNGLPDKPEYELVEDAAEALNHVNDDISDLERKLTEFKGMEIFPGDCDYIVGVDQ